MAKDAIPVIATTMIKIGLTILALTAACPKTKAPTIPIVGPIGEGTLNPASRISSKEISISKISKIIGNGTFSLDKEATIEIAKQLRLRDIGGIVIIDYIDMEKKETKQKILEILEEHVKKDRSKIQIVGFTPLDLLEVTRKHMCSND